MANADMIKAVIAETGKQDAGLAVCFMVTKVHAAIIKQFAEENVETLSELTNYFTASKYADENVTFRGKIEEFKENRLRWLA